MEVDFSRGIKDFDSDDFIVFPEVEDDVIAKLLVGQLLFTGIESDVEKIDYGVIMDLHCVSPISRMKRAR